jgi:hypothetical protein
MIADFKVNDISTIATIWQGISIPAISLVGFWAHVANSTSNSFLLYIFRFIIKPQKEKK